MLTADMKQLIRDHSAGMVASINANGTPSVSPKATFVVVDDTTIAYGDLRSPGTRANIERSPQVEVCFIDVVTRKAVRVSGKAQMIDKSAASSQMQAAFEEIWGEYVPHMSAFIRIDVSATEMIWSPGYDLGYNEQQLREANLAKLNALS